jgi:hypothetical protein
VVVRKEGGRYVVRSTTGKKLGSHATKAAADRQLRAIEASKHKDEKDKKRGQ